MEADPFSNFFSPPAHLCAVTYITEISLNVTLSKLIVLVFGFIPNYILDIDLTSFWTSLFIFWQTFIQFHEEKC